MTVSINGHTVHLATTTLWLYAVVMLIEIGAVVALARHYHLRKHPKILPDPPYPKRPL